MYVNQLLRSQGSGGGVRSPEKGRVSGKVRGHERFGLLTAAYCLAFYSYDLLVSSDSDPIF